jgi:uncharacterized protein (DUF433 family)
MRNFITKLSMRTKDVIVADAGVLSGTPDFKGTRVAVQMLFDQLEESFIDEFLIGFPSVTCEQAETVISFAGKLDNASLA